ncbi:YggS family pyridoxal phosphate-dependent enzyme [Phaeodactylibacter luteus]|uniref:Pyridoxal phosphate homeostasis protein n=1 Tax=Phaeodactylibacter luteus TaxID=1564516 RepID=A0A5C6RID8_9BACT|nr:YggS family pyridoxal phosphate-dependent enzyme [Phaeodactylibacter luteus]TXB62198.1 YggS family pyridoxal phosphate-dependent enzyme [Phaeodactylibacter luteus]
MNFKEILDALSPSGTQLVAVSKTKPNDQIMGLYRQGQRAFGENRVQELTDKHEALPKDIQWHFIGHLQTNKVKYIAPFVHLIHSIDRAKILKEVDKRAEQSGRTVSCLLQFHIAEEESKFGFDLEEARAMLSSEAFRQMQHVHIAGVMGMATFTDDQEKVRREFRQLRAIFEALKKEYFPEEPSFKEISMGMSGDYPIAIAEGSTMVRIGSLLFGSRG